MFKKVLLMATLVSTSVAAEQASGRFDVQMKSETGADLPIARWSLAKTFHGDLDAASTGVMLGTGNPASGSAGYVAIETVTGKLKGRSGGFALQHSGTMHGGKANLEVIVVPGSGSGDLAGISGSMTIDAAANHAYVLSYTLPNR